MVLRRWSTSNAGVARLLNLASSSSRVMGFFGSPLAKSIRAAWVWGVTQHEFVGRLLAIGQAALEGDRAALAAHGNVDRKSVV